MSIRMRVVILLALSVLGCRARDTVKASPEEKRTDHAPSKFFELAKGTFARGFFTADGFVVPSVSTEGSPSFEVYDLMTHAKTTVSTRLPQPFGDGPVLCNADARNILCFVWRAGAAGFVLDRLDGEPIELSTPFPGTPVEIRADESEWLVRRITGNGITMWGEVAGISRPGGNRRSVVSAPELNAFSFDDAWVYWLAGDKEPRIFRKKKLGGPTELVSAVTGPGEPARLFVRGAFVHHLGPDGTVRRAPKTGGALTDIGATNVTELAADEAGFCWCTKTAQVFCRGADDVNRPLTLPAQSCEWLAVSRSYVVAQADGAMWAAARP